MAEPQEDAPQSGYSEFEYTTGASYIGNWVERDGVKVREGHGKFIHAPIMVPVTSSSRIIPGNRGAEHTSSRHSNRSIAGSLGAEKELEEEKMKQPFTILEEYEGEWLDDQMHGYGVYRYASGAVYEGEWQEGKHHGQGTYHFPNGSKYQGFWDNQVMNGRGVFTDTTGAKWDGVFINGTFDSTIQKALKAEFEMTEKVKSLEQAGPQILNTMRQVFLTDKKTWKEAFLKNFITSPNLVDMYLSEPYCRLEDRNLDKWNDVLGQLLDAVPNVPKTPEEARIIQGERIHGAQLKGPGQILEFNKQVGNRNLELCLVQAENESWLIFHCVDAKI